MTVLQDAAPKKHRIPELIHKERNRNTILNSLRDLIHLTIKVSEARKKLKAIKKLANTMDDLPFNPFPIPIGLDTIIGLVPLIGDPLTLLIALYQVWLAFSGLGLPYPLVAFSCT
ncbi:hypothetical protein DSO57_1034489 [Entomophthora muscae]|uniref:Uncharacterized protein n=1 Tax=Entomophthora muscae TaxID=34485 RepID=A0ACC2SZR0_9FUNG|nr:hypothetical protein DSO57_1034489 [Entomophthora muscae]